MQKALLPLILSALLLTACGGGKTSLEPREKGPSEVAIIGGQEVKAGDPLTRSVVSLRDKDSHDHICTGSLLTPQIVLTAGHCVEDYLGESSKGLEIVIGISSWENEEANLFSVQKIVSHPLFLDPVRHDRDGKIVKNCLEKSPCSLETFAAVDQGDIALILLKTALPSEEVTPVILNEKIKSYPNGGLALVVGLGQHSLEDSIDTGFMRSFQTPIYRSYKDVNVSQYKKIVVPSTHETGACFGDSGGPAFVKQGKQLIQVGIGQGALEVGRKKKFACNFKSLGYTDVAAYLPWILEAKAQLEKSLETAAGGAAAK